MPLEEQKPFLSKDKPNDKEEPKKASVLGNKGIVIAAIFVIIALIIGASTLMGLGSTEQYQGYIRDLDSKLQDEKLEEVEKPEAPIETNDDQSPLPIELAQPLEAETNTPPEAETNTPPETETKITR